MPVVSPVTQFATLSFLALTLSCTANTKTAARDACAGPGPMFDVLPLPASFSVRDIRDKNKLLGVLKVPASGTPTFVAEPGTPSVTAELLETELTAFAGQPRVSAGYTREVMDGTTRLTFGCERSIARGQPEHAAAVESRLHQSVFANIRISVERVPLESAPKPGL